MKEYWDKRHKENSKWYLTGTHLSRYKGIFNIPELKFGTVVEIGVGLGHATKALCGISEKVYAVDISSVALKRVAGKAIAIKSSKMSNIPSACADAIICHLVAQHMLDATLDNQIREAIRILKPDGVFYLQFAESMQEADERETFSDETKMQEGFMFRSLATVAHMVMEHGGKITQEGTVNIRKHFIRWHIVHICKG